MKKVLAITCLLVLIAASMATAQDQPTWRMYLRAQDVNLGNAHMAVTLGAVTTSSDGVDAADFVFDWIPVVATTAFAASIIAPEPGLYLRNLMGPNAPQKYAPPQKVWELRVAAGAAYADGNIYLSWNTVGATVRPPTTVLGAPMVYSLLMIDNKGKAGAPANGTKWNLPIPAAHPTNVVICNVPTIKLSAMTDAAFLNEGYKMAMIQEAVPEPSALLAFGSGIVGLVGLAVRRRRA